MKKKIVSVLLAGMMVMGVLTACGGGGTQQAPAAPAAEEEEATEEEAAEATEEAAEEGGASIAEGSGKVTLWATGSDNVRQIYETLIADFNTNSEYAGQYEVELQFMLSGTGAQTLPDMLNAAYQAGQTETDFDLVDFSGDDLSKIMALVGEEGFQKLDETKIPNRANVPAKSSVSADYSQPYRGTTVILAYDSEKVPEPPKTVDELVKWMEENPGRFAYNAPGTGGAGDSFARTSVYNFLPEEAITSDDESWTEQWDEGFAFLESIHPYMYASGGSIVYPNKNQGALDLLNQGEIDMCPNWADMVLSQRASGELKSSIKIAQISPSFTGSLQTLTVPTIGSNEAGAYAFINYMLSETAQQIMVKDMAAIPLIDTSNMDMSGFEDIANLDVSSFRIISIGNLGTTFNERWDNEIGTLQ